MNNPLLGVARVSGDRVVSFFRRLNHHYPADLGPGLFPAMCCFLERACMYIILYVCMHVCVCVCVCENVCVCG